MTMGVSSLPVLISQLATYHYIIGHTITRRLYHHNTIQIDTPQESTSAWLDEVRTTPPQTNMLWIYEQTPHQEGVRDEVRKQFLIVLPNLERHSDQNHMVSMAHIQIKPVANSASVCVWIKQLDLVVHNKQISTEAS